MRMHSLVMSPFTKTQSISIHSVLIQYSHVDSSYIAPGI